MGRLIFVRGLEVMWWIMGFVKEGDDGYCG